MKTEKHTPTPWQATFDDLSGYDCMSGSWHIGTTNRILAEIDQCHYGQKSCDYNFRSNEAKANAAFIVRAVNAHDALVEALGDLLNKVEAEALNDRELEPRCKKARAALKAAKGEE